MESCFSGHHSCAGRDAGREKFAYLRGWQQEGQKHERRNQQEQNERVGGRVGWAVRGRMLIEQVAYRNETQSSGSRAPVN